MNKNSLLCVVRILVPILMIFLPMWCDSLLFRSGEAAVWNPLAIGMLWFASVPEFFSYSPPYCCGALFSLGLCLYWFERYPSFFYGMLLFFAAAMAGPTWTVLVRLWHYLA